LEKISFSFTGGIADEHELNFYEAGRFQYGAARFIYTLERFRQEGKVISRLTTKVKADIRVKAPQEGSFLQDVLVVAVPAITECAINTSFESIFAYAWDKLLPKSKGTDVAVEIARKEVEREREQTKQEAEKTKQFQTLESVANAGFATTQQALDIIRTVLENGAPSASGHTPSELGSFHDELQGQLIREQIVRENATQLARISPETERKLAGQLRRTVQDISLPLRSSASNLNVSAPSVGKVANLDRETARRITEVEEDILPDVIRGNIKSYDVESGVGKFRYDELQNPLPFRVPSAMKDSLKDRILDSMKKEDVLIRAYFVRDTYNNPTALVLDEILEDEGYDQVHR
jgi:hypothetical protein